MRAATLLLVALLLAGCATTTTTSTVHVGGGSRSVGGGIVIPAFPEPVPEVPIPQLARDPQAPPVWRAGETTFASAVLVKETWRDRRVEQTRHPCGGAIFASAEGWGDPRPHAAAFTYVESIALRDGLGRLWVTDLYAHPQHEGVVLWVQNLGGDASFVPDEHPHDCDPRERGSGPWNALLHVEGPARLDVWYSPSVRPHQPG